MGKVYRHLYDQVCAWENLLSAWRKARKGKRGRPPAARFEMNAAENLLTIQRMTIQSSDVISVQSYRDYIPRTAE
ncbi:hypothetical protein GC175_32735 [bacterium]|nr:hypothetical protein [bacterium]